MYYYGFDWTYLALVLPALIFTMWAQSNVSSTYNKYSSMNNRRGYTGADIARMILDRNDLGDIPVEHISGSLTDNYNPTDRVVRLSDSVYASTSVAAIGVAAHECGHAIQHNVGYFPIKVRMAIIPVTSLMSKIALPLFILGLILNFQGLTDLGIICFGAAVVFQAVTLPVEFNASSRALEILSEYSALNEEELSASKKVLRAAALTYVAALATSLAQLLRFIMLSRGRRRG